MSEQVPGLTVNRWKRYGKDRLYVTAGETKVGYWDLLTGEGHPESPDLAPTLEAAVQGWQAEQAVPGATPVPVVPVSPPTAPVIPSESAVAGSAVVDVVVPVAEPAVVVVPSRTPEAADAPAQAVASIPDTAPARPWIDLATNRAGAEAREQALAAREAAPVRTFLARALGVHTDERAWRIGADGEEKVAAQLAKAAKKDPRWRFVHAIPVGERGSDIDHLIVGPGGVFTANAKHHPGAKIWVGGNTFMVNGHRQPYIRNSRHEAARAAKLLTAACGFPVHVEGLIVTVNADDVTVKDRPDGVSVVPRMRVAKWLLRHGDILTDEVLDAIFEAARRSTTWRP